jgi:hypothetical protein
MQKNSRQGFSLVATSYQKGLKWFPGSGGVHSKAVLRTRMDKANTAKVSFLCLTLNCLLTSSHLEFCLEWSKAYTRQAQWREESMLLKEEMR